MSELKSIIHPTSIEHEMRTSFIDYAMSVIISRALPNVRDGLKPVHRRILYAMYGLKNSYSQPYKKSARIVGDVIGKYHPHGDSAVYDALVRMAQEFSMRYMLADGQGNFGSIDGDPAAAMRYTEVRMARMGGEMLADIDKETVPWAPNYDEKEMEPEILPTRVPALLINGAQGIAVGMATSIPPHNLAEVLDATIALIRNPEIGIAELMQFIPGPDFPTAGMIHGREGILKAYKTGRGHVIMRGRACVEEGEKGRRTAIIISELPYQVNKAKLVEKIALLVKEKKLEGIADLRDESDRQGIRVVVELKRDIVGEVVLNRLYKLTQLQDTFGVNMLAIVDGQPRTLTLREMIKHFIEHRRDVVTKRSVFELREARSRAHILEGLKIALDNIDEVIKLIRAAPSPAAAKEGLQERFGLSAIQSQAILDMRLQRLTGLERDKILAELAEVMARIAYLEGILGDRDKLMEVVVGEMEEVRERYADDRRTEILDATGEIGIEDLIAEEDMVVTVTHSGYIKRTSIDTYRAQRRGGRGVKGVGTKDDDFVRELFVANTHDLILLFTNTGRVYCKKVWEVPPGGRTSRGRAIVNMLDLRKGESVHQLLAIKQFEEGRFVLAATRRGVVKKTRLMDYVNVRATGIIAIDLEDGDELIDVRLTDGENHVMLSTRQGMAIRFPEENVRAMGRVARGVRGIKLRDGDHVVQMAVLSPDSEDNVVTVCEHGYGKRTAASEFPAQKRGGLGLIGIKTTDRNGNVAGTQVVTDEHELMIITTGGKVIRMSLADISVIGRNTQGVRLIRLDKKEKVVAVERLAEEEDGEDEEVGEGEDQEPGAENREPGTENQEPETENQEPGAGDPDEEESDEDAE